MVKLDQFLLSLSKPLFVKNDLTFVFIKLTWQPGNPVSLLYRENEPLSDVFPIKQKKITIYKNPHLLTTDLTSRPFTVIILWFGSTENKSETRR